jgi:hypothetical protein
MNSFHIDYSTNTVYRLEKNENGIDTWVAGIREVDSGEEE